MWFLGKGLIFFGLFGEMLFLPSSTLPKQTDPTSSDSCIRTGIAMADHSHGPFDRWYSRQPIPSFHCIWTSLYWLSENSSLSSIIWTILWIHTTCRLNHGIHRWVGTQHTLAYTVQDYEFLAENCQFRSWIRIVQSTAIGSWPHETRRTVTNLEYSQLSSGCMVYFPVTKNWNWWSFGISLCQAACVIVIRSLYRQTNRTNGSEVWFVI